MNQNHSTDQPAGAQEFTKSLAPNTDQKSELRRYLLQLRRDLDAQQRAVWDGQICEQILSWWQENRPSSLGVFWPIQAEPDLFACYQALQAAGVTLALPVVQGPQQALRFARWEVGMPTRRAALGVPIPAECEWLALPTHLLIPCLGFDAAGFRLGYGGGYYDRTLAQTPSSQGLGIAYPCLQTNFNKGEFDIPMQTIFTGESQIMRHQASERNFG